MSVQKPIAAFAGLILLFSFAFTQTLSLTSFLLRSYTDLESHLQ